jgi:hypothetical protein
MLRFLLSIKIKDEAFFIINFCFDLLKFLH